MRARLLFHVKLFTALTVLIAINISALDRNRNIKIQ